MKISLLAAMASITLSGCAFVPDYHNHLDRNARVLVNDPGAVAEFKAYKLRMESVPGTVTMPLARALELHVPSGFKVVFDADIDLLLPLQYETALAWPQALEKSLDAVGFVLTVDQVGKIVSLKPDAMSVLQVVERFVPADIQVFPEENVNLDAKVVYDRAGPWRVSLARALDAVGIDIEADPGGNRLVLRVRR